MSSYDILLDEISYKSSLVYICKSRQLANEVYSANPSSREVSLGESLLGHSWLRFTIIYKL